MLRPKGAITIRTNETPKRAGYFLTVCAMGYEFHRSRREHGNPWDFSESVVVGNCRQWRKVRNLSLHSFECVCMHRGSIGRLATSRDGRFGIRILTITMRPYAAGGYVGTAFNRLYDGRSLALRFRIAGPSACSSDPLI